MCLIKQLWPDGCLVSDVIRATSTRNTQQMANISTVKFIAWHWLPVEPDSKPNTADVTGSISNHKLTDLFITNNECTFSGRQIKTRWPRHPLWHCHCCSVKIENTHWNKITALHRFTLSRVQHAPHHSTDITLSNKNRTRSSGLVLHVLISRIEIWHRTKQYETNNTKCHYKGINDLLNQVSVSSVQQNVSSTFQHCHMLSRKRRKYHTSTTNPNKSSRAHNSNRFLLVVMFSVILLERFPWRGSQSTAG